MNSQRMVGEMQGENQWPPESVRKGRRCRLLTGLTEAQFMEEWRFDYSQNLYVVYSG